MAGDRPVRSLFAGGGAKVCSDGAKPTPPPPSEENFGSVSLTARVKMLTVRVYFYERENFEFFY